MRYECRLRHGFTLIEVVLGVLTLLVAATAILGAYMGQLTLNEHARNLSLAVHDANRVIEQIRRNTAACGPPGTLPSVAVVNGWDAWLAANGGKSLPGPEQIVVTCQNQAGAAYCGTGGAAQVATQEWAKQAGTTVFDPLRVTVAVCWRHRQRTIGECAWNGATLTPDQNVNVGNDTANVIDSPAMLTTLATCRG